MTCQTLVSQTPVGWAADCLDCVGSAGGALDLGDWTLKREAETAAKEHRDGRETDITTSEPAGDTDGSLVWVRTELEDLLTQFRASDDRRRFYIVRDGIERIIATLREPTLDRDDT